MILFFSFWIFLAMWYQHTHTHSGQEHQGESEQLSDYHCKGNDTCRDTINLVSTIKGHARETTSKQEQSTRNWPLLPLCDWILLCCPRFQEKPTTRAIMINLAGCFFKLPSMNFGFRYRGNVFYIFIMARILYKIYYLCNYRIVIINLLLAIIVLFNYGGGQWIINLDYHSRFVTDSHFGVCH